MTDISAYFEQERKLGNREIVQERRKPRTGRSRRPSLMREVIVPSGLFAASAGGFFAGSGLAALFATSKPPDWYGVVLSAALCAASVAGGLAAAYLMPHYHALQWSIERDEMKPKPRREVNGRPLVRVDRKTDVVLQAPWVGNWRRRLAQRLHDQRGDWTGTDKPNRHLFTGLVTDHTRYYHKDNRTIQGDLQRLGWLDVNDRWTAKARAELGMDLFLEA